MIAGFARTDGQSTVAQPISAVSPCLEIGDCSCFVGGADVDSDGARAVGGEGCAFDAGDFARRTNAGGGVV